MGATQIFKTTSFNPSNLERLNKFGLKLIKMAQSCAGMVDPAIFTSLQAKIDEDIEIRDQLKVILQTLEKNSSETASNWVDQLY